MAIRAAYATIKTIKRGFVRGVVDALLDEWVAKLEEYYAGHVTLDDGDAFLEREFTNSQGDGTCSFRNHDRCGHRLGIVLQSDR